MRPTIFVLYLYSTSNHNFSVVALAWNEVVLYLYSTSNHNLTLILVSSQQLSYISILHQTTTRSSLFACMYCCLISLFYIKPQLCAAICRFHPVVLYLYSTSNHNTIRIVHAPHTVVLYLYSTSNHNFIGRFEPSSKLSYISILHQTTTATRGSVT